VPSLSYEVGTYTIDKHGTLHGEYNIELLMGLTAAGFTRTDIAPEELLEAEAAPLAEATSDTLETAEPEAEIDNVCIEVPLDGFTPESLDNLCRMVTAKEPLIKKALGVEAIPIRVLDNRISFPWFNFTDPDTAHAYSQFISALCATAKTKKRVTAKPQETFENERFTMRVWLIGLGLVGSEYSKIRQLLTKPLSGNGAWRFGTQEKTVNEDASEPLVTEVATDLPDNAARNIPADEIPADDDDANVADTNADTAVDDNEVNI
jgi:hypothetical protein